MNQKRKNIPAFLKNTYEMLERQDLESIVCWAQQGNGFLIQDIDKFVEQVLPQYFKHKKYTSFVRQLNMYGFHKQRHHHNYSHFSHQHFCKGQIDHQDNQKALSQIKRKPQKKKKQTDQIHNNQLNSANKFKNQYSKYEQQQDVQRSVSLDLQDQKDIKDSLINLQSIIKQNQFQESQKKLLQLSSQVQSQKQIIRLDYLQIALSQNEILKNFHHSIRQQVIKSKKRSLQIITNSIIPQDFERLERNSVIKLINQLQSGIQLSAQILKEK